MGKQILTTLGWTVILFIVHGAVTYFTNVDGWFVATLNWVIPSAVGFFMGYGQARSDKNR